MRSLRRTTTVAVAAWVLASALAAAPAAGAGSFIRLRFYPGGEASAEDRPTSPNPITLAFNGEVFEDRVWISRKADAGGTLSADEEFIMRVVRANAGSDRRAILDLWEPAERAAIEAEMADAEQLRRNRITFRNVSDSAFVAKILYGPYTLFMVHHERQLGDIIMVYPARQSDGTYLLTNALEDDPMLEFLYFYYRDQLSTEGESTASR